MQLAGQVFWMGRHSPLSIFFLSHQLGFAYDGRSQETHLRLPDRRFVLTYGARWILGTLLWNACIGTSAIQTKTKTNFYLIWTILNGLCEISQTIINTDTFTFWTSVHSNPHSTRDCAVNSAKSRAALAHVNSFLGQGYSLLVLS